ncbi:alpha/beta fold hydrolase [Streptomyces sp. V3I7]|uniref:alpha/beta fold hydrolase n=1 Tax=Streptomyces sp. V3I7 TaxID=3042278 RepID=UPI00278A7784|nr:alpha/beta hydrolase [Streptomyces sp. V3I7]MDQ0993195.1 pimeloyl-ACP methyl ester carboxylesterase [Streptomyces sp. V3I7]
MDKQIISRDGTLIVHDLTGEGPAVILVSGAMATGATMAPLAARLADRFTVIAYDRRGRGESGDTAPYAVDREVEDLAVLIEAAGGEAALYGVGAGGALALEAAASGLPVRQVAVYEAPFSDHKDGGRERAEYVRRLAEALGEDRRGDAVELYLRLTGMAEEMIQRARSSPLWADMESLAPTLSYDAGVMRDGLLPRERVVVIAVPVLAMAGGASSPWLHAAARDVANLAPQGTYRLLEGQTRMVDPDVLTPVLTEFFAD